MRSRKRRLGLLAAAAVVTVTVTAACSSSGGSSDGTTSLFGAQPQTVINVNTNWFTTYAEKEFGLKFSFSTVPGADVATKQPLLLSSGDYPDIIWSGDITPTEAIQYGQQGIFIPLNNLIKKYAPNLWKAIQTIPGYKQDVTAPDEKIYALPSYNYCFHCFFTDQMWINVKYLNEYHLAMPRTTGQLEQVLEVFKQHGLVPLTGAPGYSTDPTVFLMNAFIPYNGPDAGPTDQYVNVTDGQPSFAPAQNQWRSGLEYMHQLYTNGLLPQTDFTQTSDQMISLVTQEKAGVFPQGGPNGAISDYGANGSNYQDWFSLPPLKGPGGVQSVSFEGGGFNGFVFAITNRASTEQAEKILRLVNFMYTAKGAQMEDFGPSGKYWTPAKKGQQGLIPQQALFNTDWNAFYSGNSEQNAGWNQWGPYDQSYTWRNLSYSPPAFSADGAQTLMQLSSQLYYAGHQPVQEYPPIAWVTPTESEQFGSEQTNIINYVESATDQFITGSKSLTSDWSSYLSGLNKLGLADYMSTLTKAMTKPLDASVSEYQPSQSDIKYLLDQGSVPPVTEKYLEQTGIPATYFQK